MLQFFFFFFPVQCSLFGHSVENEYSLICLLCTVLSIVNICSYQSCLTLKGSSWHKLLCCRQRRGEKEVAFRDWKLQYHTAAYSTHMFFEIFNFPLPVFSIVATKMEQPPERGSLMIGLSGAPAHHDLPFVTQADLKGSSANDQSPG